jgi:hypothetical protein
MFRNGSWRVFLAGVLLRQSSAARGGLTDCVPLSGTVCVLASSCDTALFLLRRSYYAASRCTTDLVAKRALRVAKSLRATYRIARDIGFARESHCFSYGLNNVLGNVAEL